MSNKTFLNITNGDLLNDRLIKLRYEGEFLSWSEMLCEGPTSEFIGSNEYFELRSKFFNDFYDLIFEEHKFHKSLKKLENFNEYSHIVLWFEYDLFCHMNLLAVLSMIQQRNIKLPIYLVCSGYTSKEHTLTFLNELSDKQLRKHYDEKIKLTDADMEMAYDLWKIYCGKDHNLFKPYIVMKSSFKYLSNCLKAHLTRFPNAQSGLNVLERNALEMITKHNIKSKHHLLGYILNYQGYYGYGDTQIKRIIDNLEPFFDVKDEHLVLNQLGQEALKGLTNMSAVVNNTMIYGGVNRLDFQYSPTENKLIKPRFNAPSRL